MIMNKRKTTQKERLLKELSHQNHDGYWYGMHELIGITGRSQSSLYMSLKGLESDGCILSKYSKLPASLGGGLPKQIKVYMLTENKEKQDDLETRQEQKNKEEKIEADRLGIDVFSLRMRKLGL